MKTELAYLRWDDYPVWSYEFIETCDRIDKTHFKFNGDIYEIVQEYPDIKLAAVKKVEHDN